MNYTFKKLLNDNNNIVGYKTIGLNKELTIKIHLNEKIASVIFEKLSKTEKIPNKIEGIVNVDIYIKETENEIILIFPDQNGIYPWEDNCSELFKKQIN